MFLTQIRLPQLHPVNTEWQSLVRDRLPSDTIDPVNLETGQTARQSQRIPFVTPLRKANCKDFFESQGAVFNLVYEWLS